MTENEAKERCDLLINSLSVNNGVESAFRNYFKGYMDFTTMREFAQTCKKALEEVQQYRTIGTPEEFRAMAEKQTAMKKHCDEEGCVNCPYNNPLLKENRCMNDFIVDVSHEV